MNPPHHQNHGDDHDLRGRRPAGRRGGFTLIEMMMVIGIIGLLVTITVLVAEGVVGQSKRRQCDKLMEALDSLLTEYESAYQSMPSFDPRDYREPENGDAGEVRPEVAVFLAEVEGLSGGERILAGLPTQFLRVREEYYDETVEKGEQNHVGRLNVTDRRLTLIDPWGVEILYVHPRDKRATVGDNAPGQFAGFGTPANERPYFVSAGPDRFFYTEGEDEPTEDVRRKDNIYSYDAVIRPEDE